MDPRGYEPHRRGVTDKLQEKIECFYYTLGLVCITYPVCVLIFAVCVIIVTWLPLVNYPFPGKEATIWTDNINSTKVEPFCFIQQVIMRVAVIPWDDDLNVGDAFRAPLYETFKLLDVVRNYQDQESLKTLGHVCLHIEALKRTKPGRPHLLPEYNCLVLSPANLWHQDVQQFTQDSSILVTIFNHHSFQKGKTSVAEMLFGMNLFDTGVKRYPIRNRQRIIQYAMTLFFKEYDENFINGLRKKLISLYPLHQNESKHLNFNSTVFIHYPAEINFKELAPFIFAYILVVLYYYFSIRKIELIKSKTGMAFTAAFTIFSNLTTTLGICFFFGLHLSCEDTKAIFPYLVILVGLENVLVLTKSVVSTPLHLDVKIRNAQGLSKEGWLITKNLFLEITVFTFGLFTFVPAIQEFCIFSIVGLVMDFFLQLFFFLTILGLDISRTVKSIEKTNQGFRNGLYQAENVFEKPCMSSRGISRSMSHPRLSSFPTNVVAGQTQTAQEKKIPKRVRLFNVWARTRFFQRSFMILMIVWIGMIGYKSEIMNHYLLNTVLHEKNEENISYPIVENYLMVTMFPMTNNSIPMNYVTYNPPHIQKSADSSNISTDINKLRHPDRPWPRLSARHWPAVLRQYGMAAGGHVIAVLPSLRLAHVIEPEQAVLLRNPDETYGGKYGLKWHALAVALDPIDFSDMDPSTDSATENPLTLSRPDRPFYPTSPMEILLTAILCFISALVLAYLFVLLYRCVCTRNYAEWRASWHRGSSEEGDERGEERVLLEAAPVAVEGHRQMVECIATDGRSIVSACLGGHLKVWDNSTGELLYHIDRKAYFSADKTQDQSLEFEDTLSDYESGSPPSRDESFPKLLNKINTDFSYNTVNKSLSFTDSKYDFNKAYRYFYFNHNYDVKLRHRYSCLKDDNKQNSFSESFKRNSEFQKNNESEISFGSDSSRDNIANNLTKYKLAPIWCMDYVDNLIVIGCADGRLEFWEGTTGKLKCIFEDGTDSGMTHVKIIGAKVVAARLCGLLEFFQLQTYNEGRPIDWNFTCAYRRTHIRTGSVGSISESDHLGNQSSVAIEDELLCVKLHSSRAHHQPITCMDCEGGRVLTGSRDHAVRAFRLADGSPSLALHGHNGPLTCLFIDRVCPATAGSGSQDGMLCVWDLVTGTCMYSIQAHNGSITSLTYSASYVITLGVDERLCVWERFQGHLLNAIYVSQPLSNQVLMLAQHLVVTGRSGGLIIWDVRTGECMKSITLGRAPFIFINQMILLRDAVLCDYGNQLRIVRFPLITHKFD